jgi:integrase
VSVDRRQTSKGTVYDVRLRTPDGRAYKRTFRTRKQAQAFEGGEIASKSKGAWIDPRGSRTTFGNWSAEWKQSNPSKRPSSLARDDSVLRNHLLPLLAERPLGSITPREVQGLVNDWASTAAPRTVSRQYDVLRAILATAVEVDLLARTPCRGIKLPRPDDKPRLALQPGELADLATAIGPEWEVMVWLGALLGLRWGECAGLRVGRIDFAGGRVHVTEQVTRAGHGRMIAGPPKSEAGRRTLSAPGALLELLECHLVRKGLTTLDEHALLFSTPNGDLLDYSHWRSRVWGPACKKAGVAGRVFHDLRRVNATTLVAEGVDLKTAQARLGHSDPRLTLAIYAQATTEGDRAAAERVAARLRPG